MRRRESEGKVNEDGESEWIIKGKERKRKVSVGERGDKKNGEERGAKEKKKENP